MFDQSTKRGRRTAAQVEEFIFSISVFYKNICLYQTEDSRDAERETARASHDTKVLVFDLWSIPVSHSNRRFFSPVTVIHGVINPFSPHSGTGVTILNQLQSNITNKQSTGSVLLNNVRSAPDSSFLHTVTEPLFSFPACAQQKHYRKENHVISCNQRC